MFSFVVDLIARNRSMPTPRARSEYKIIGQEVLHLINQIKAQLQRSVLADVRTQDHTFVPTIAIVHIYVGLP